jgi:predicted dithiol-disulfide oxidoreductase (DUF899 family)
MLCVSRAPRVKLNAHLQHMGWSFRWVSALRNDFNYDFGVSLPADEDSDSVVYNLKTAEGATEEHNAAVAEHRGPAGVEGQGIVHSGVQEPGRS